MLRDVTVLLYGHSEKAIYFCEEAKLKNPPFFCILDQNKNHVIGNPRPATYLQIHYFV